MRSPKLIRGTCQDREPDRVLPYVVEQYGEEYHAVLYPRSLRPLTTAWKGSEQQARLDALELATAFGRELREEPGKMNRSKRRKQR